MTYNGRFYVVNDGGVLRYEDRRFSLTYARAGLESYIEQMSKDFRRDLPIFKYALRGLEMIKAGQTGLVIIEEK